MIKSRLKLLRNFLEYYFRAKSRYDIHSPFVAEFIKKVLEDKRWFYSFSNIEGVREWLKQRNDEISIVDYGAGSKVDGSKKRKIAAIAKSSAISHETGQMYFRLLHWLKPSTILELGTSFGISTLYLSYAAPTSRIITIEGCPETAAIASQHFEKLKLKNIQLMNGRFEDKLPQALDGLKQLDFLFLDGDHRAGASLQYFEQCLRYAHENSVFVIADIYWSDEMKAAWQQMKAHPKVRISIDLYHFGVLFFREEHLQKEHFVIAPHKWKPWRIGLFYRK